jgi:hypothetical protein
MSSVALDAAPRPRRRSWPLILFLAVAAVAAAGADAVAPKFVPAVGVGVIAVAVVKTQHRRVFSWRWLFTTMILIIFFIPIRRYELPGSLPFSLEPYRIIVAFVALGWIASLLVDRRVRAATTGFEPPLALLSTAIVMSVLLNHGRIEALLVQSDVTKKLTFFASYFLVVYMIVSIVRTYEFLDYIIRVLVGCGAVLSVFALIEGVTHYNFFNHLQGKVPLLHWEGLPFSLYAADTRGGRLRVYASAEHPIALAAALVMLAPLAVYVARTRGRRWWPAVAIIFLACFATVSRTAIVMLLIVLIMYLIRRRRETLRLWPLVVPALVIIHLALPGALGAFKETFFPKGGIVAEQEQGKGTRGSGRLADVPGAIGQWKHAAVFGIGFGTRVIDKQHETANILDDEWLSTLLEVGAVGVFAWIWLFTRFVRRLSHLARDDLSERGWLALGLASGVFAFSVGMLTYDALSFVQVTFLMFIYLGLGGALLRLDAEAKRAAAA